MDWAAAQAALRAPVYAPVAGALARLDPGRWPGLADLDRLAGGITNARGVPIRFVAPRAQHEARRAHYELHIARTGEVATRPGNWHDLFNALAWVAWPRAKAAINAQHAAMLDEGGAAEARRRSPSRDALTLFDEGGVAVLSEDPSLLELIVAHRWKALFWERRAQVASRMRFVAFGHALLEKMLAPYIGLVAKCVLLEVEGGVTAMPSGELQGHVDAQLATHFGDRSRFASPRLLPPVPVLGIPGWHSASEHEAFYDDPVHFR